MGTPQAPDWLFSGHASLGIRFAICDSVEIRDGSGDLDEMALVAVVKKEGVEPIYLIGAHISCMSEFGYPYDFWEYRAVQMQENKVPLVRETTDEEDKIISAEDEEE